MFAASLCYAKITPAVVRRGESNGCGGREREVAGEIPEFDFA
jgi:hypothetical protein